MKLCLSAKAGSGLMEQIIHQVKALHSYTVPEIIALPILSDTPEYLAWLADSTKNQGTKFGTPPYIGRICV